MLLNYGLFHVNSINCTLQCLLPPRMRPSATWHLSWKYHFWLRGEQLDNVTEQTCLAKAFHNIQQILRHLVQNCYLYWVNTNKWGLCWGVTWQVYLLLQDIPFIVPSFIYLRMVYNSPFLRHMCTPTAATAAKPKKIKLEIIEQGGYFSFLKEPTSWKHSKACYKNNQWAKLGTHKNIVSTIVI